MNNQSDDVHGLTADERVRLEQVRDAFELAWQSDDAPKLEQHLTGFQGQARMVLLRELLQVELAFRVRDGGEPNASEYVTRFPADETVVRAVVDTVMSKQPGARARPAPKSQRTPGNEPLRTEVAPGGQTDSSTRHPTPMPSRIGDYEVLEEIARGGMGIVYKVRHQSLRRIVALKMILTGNFACDAEVRRFYSEAMIAAQLDHPGIVPVFEVGQHGNQHYFTMGYVEGASLAQRVARGPLPEREAAEIVAALADAVQYAHDKGIIHRDLKPQNVLMADGNQPRITDFGLAKVVLTDSSLTASGQILGTPSYMPPEQARGERAAVGKHSDIYSLGAILFCLVTARPPFESANVIDTLRLVLDTEPLHPRQLVPTLNVDLETVCLKCLSKEPVHRYSSALALAEDLRRFLRQEPISARPVGKLTRTWRWCRRKPVAAGLCLALIAVALSLAVTVFLARKANLAIELTDLNQQFETELDSPSLHPDYLEKMDQLIAGMAKYDQGQADSANSRLLASFGEHVRAAILRPKLTEQDVEELQAAIELLTRRDPQTALELAESLQARHRDWQELFRLDAPFSDLERIWPDNWFQANDAGVELVHRAAVPDETQYLPTRFSSQGDVAMDAIFAPGWSRARRLGLTLHGDDGASDTRSGYQFILRRDDEAGEPISGDPSSLGMLAEIRRDGARLRMRRLSINALDDNSLHLHAERNGNRLILQVNQQEPLVMEELFAPVGGGSGWLALEMDSNVSLQQLTAVKKSRSRAASDLEAGDQLFAAGQFAEAQRVYGEQANTIDDDEYRHEARFKQGLSLMELKRPDAARELFEKLVTEQSQHWSPLAACQLWLIQLQAGHIEEADRIFDAISYQYHFEELAVLVPAETRQRIVEAYSQGVGGGLDATRPNPRRIQRLERLVAVQRLLDASPKGLVVATQSLMEAYHWENQLDLAEQAGRNLLAEPSLTPVRQCLVLSNLTSILIAKGTANELLPELDRRLFIEKPGSIREPYVRLLVSRAQILAAGGDFQEASRNIDQYFEVNLPVSVSSFISASLLRGFICEELGQKSEALECWRKGFRVARDKKRLGSLPATILGSLTNEYTLDDARQTLQGVITANSDSPVISFLQQKLAPDEMIHTMLRNTWQTPRARDWARKYALCQVPAAEADYMQMHFAANEIWRQCVAGSPELDPPLTAEQEQVVFQLTELLWQAWLDGNVTEVQIVQAALAWRGTTNVFGWSGLAPSLDGPLRAHFAYVFGCRYKHLQKPGEAVKLLRVAIADGPEESGLRQLAEAELEQLTGSDGTQ